MKTARDWSKELPQVNSESWRYCDLRNAVSLEDISRIQQDAYQQGQKDCMAWVSQECKKNTERLQSKELSDLLLGLGK